MDRVQVDTVEPRAVDSSYKIFYITAMLLLLLYTGISLSLTLFSVVTGSYIDPGHLCRANRPFIIAFNCTLSRHPFILPAWPLLFSLC